MRYEERWRHRLSWALLVVLGSFLDTPSWADDAVPLSLAAKIPLGSVQGRIDHMALDAQRQLLYVAELGNNSIGVVDLKTRQVTRQIGGLSEPQGVGYVASSDLLFVANAGDGSVRWYKGSDGSPVGRISLGGDADNLHVDLSTSRVYVGYGNGGIAVLDGSSGQKVGDVVLNGHPEGFDLDTESSATLVNIPDRKEAVAIDRMSLKITNTWRIADPGQNFPVAVDYGARRFITAFRGPAALVAYAIDSGAKLASASVCEDADDLFIDRARGRLYVPCGAGFVDVFDIGGGSLKRVAEIPTVAGARTGLYVPELNELFLAVRAAGSEPAAVWIFAPVS